MKKVSSKNKRHNDSKSRVGHLLTKKRAMATKSPINYGYIETKAENKDIGHLIVNSNA